MPYVCPHAWPQNEHPKAALSSAHLNAVRHSLCLGQVEQVGVQLHAEGDGGRRGRLVA